MNAYSYYTPILTNTHIPMPQDGDVYILASSLKKANEEFEAYLEAKGYFAAYADAANELMAERGLRELSEEEVKNIDPKKII